MSDQYQAPRTGVEIALVKIWEQALSIDTIGIKDHFTDDLGGDSITAVRIIEPIQNKIGVTLQMTALFDAPTIVELASYLTKNYKNQIHLLMDYAAETQEIVVAENNTLSEQQLSAFSQSLHTLFEIGNHKPQTVKEKLPSATFILSPPRSGSTLLRIMLAGHANLFAPQELNLLPFSTMKQRSQQTGERLAFFMQEGLIQAFMQANDWDKDTATAFVQDMEKNDASIKDVYAALQTAIGDRVLVDKSPLNASYALAVEQIESLFESPKYIHLTRHPYGMIQSYAEERSDMLFPFKLDMDATQAAEANWFNSHQTIQNGLADIPMRRQMHLTFEQLTASPETSMQQVCRFLNLDYDSSLTKPYDNSAQRMTQSANENGIMIGDRKFYQHKSIDSKVAETWKNNYQKDFLRADTLQLASTFGYKSIEEIGTK